MGFNERTHAFIAAKYYVHLTERFGERGKAAFLHATRYYGEQRGGGWPRERSAMEKS